MIETWDFCEDQKPIVLHYKDDDNNADDNNNNNNKFLSFVTW